MKTINLKNEISILVNKLQNKDYESVINKATILLKKFPQNDFLWNLKGLALQSSKKVDESIDCFQQALKVDSKNFAAINNLGNSYKRNNQLVMAEKCYDKCLKENSENLNSIINLANLKVILNKYEEAIKLYLKAISINNDVPIFFINLIMAYQSTNQFDKSLELLKECLEKFPNDTKFDKLMSFQTSYNNNHSHFLNMLKKIKQENLKDENKIDLHFALGKAYDDMKIFDQAYENFEKGNHLKRKMMEFNINDKKKLFEDIKSYFFEYNFSNKIKKNYSKNFIFIFGLPRSGTTLTEKIISSHKLVSAAGEINYINNFFGKYFVDKNRLNKETISNYLQKDLCQNFINFLEPFDFQNKIITDKSLNIYWYIGFIKIFFPQAKFIHCKRDPKDNCLSIFKNLFEDGEGWKFNEEELIEYHKLYQNIMNYWNDKFKDEILNINYEDLINNTKSKVEEILNFCDLEWDENCMQHHKNKSPIKTLSLNQANKPIYKTSLNSADNYKNYLKKIYKNFG